MSENVNGTTESTAPAVTQALEAKPEEVGFKVFVGNISFSTKEDELKELFGKYGQTSSAQIIHRGPRHRSLGYGFVTFVNEESATSSIKALDKTEVNGRTINVEMAKPPEKVKAVANAAADKAGIDKGAEGEAGAEVKEGRGKYRGRGRGRFRGRGRGRGGRGRRPGPRADGEIDDEGKTTVKTEDQPAEVTATDAEKPKKKKNNRRKKSKKDGEGEEAEGAAKEPKAPRPKKQRGPPTGEPSKTLLFVANLPFAVDDAGLTELFTGLTPPLTVTSAHVVRRKGKRAGGRSKGFGFVEVKDEAEQGRAVAELNNKSIGEGEQAREIQVKVAVGTENVEEGKEETAVPNGAAEAAVTA